ncbi:MAG: ribulose-phosphate 3-epimerase [Endomicrobium sp.]|jgi:ribulose-phosphate 3-epimerase|nr:ribulose-phosphate 3-epimerase [Endomicrobium sp.]
MKKTIIAPSLLSANFASLENSLKAIAEAGADWVHIDVMDGHFVPNIAIGPAVVESLRKVTKLFFDVHLMVTNPGQYWQHFQKAGANSITFHDEIEFDKMPLIEAIKASNIKAGISIKPKTPISKIERLLPYVDLVLIMTVEPGFGGQSFMKDMVPKIEYLRGIIDKNRYNCLIEIDGGINAQTSSVCVEAGADVLVSGNYIFSSNNVIEAVKSLFI